MVLNTEDLKVNKRETILVLQDFYFYLGEEIPNYIKDAIKHSKTIEEVSCIRRRCIDQVLTTMEENK